MSKLNKNWLTESHIDFELKKYTLLAYLQDVQFEYKSNRIYPWLSELIEHYKNLTSIKENTGKLKDSMAKDVSAFDLNELKLKYDEAFIDDEMFETLNEIIDFSLPLFAQNIKDGKTIYDFVEDHLNLEAVGISPINTNEGYLLLQSEKENIHAYQYAISFFDLKDEKHRSLTTSHIQDYTFNLTTSFQKVKSDLISNNKELPNPAVYALKCDLSIPLQETFLPIAKRYFISKMGY